LLSFLFFPEAQARAAESKNLKPRFYLRTYVARKRSVTGRSPWVRLYTYEAAPFYSSASNSATTMKLVLQGNPKFLLTMMLSALVALVLVSSSTNRYNHNKSPSVMMAHALVIPTTSRASRNSSRSPPASFRNRQTFPFSTTALQERKWNFNSDGRNPWGVKRNAEVWNGRVAQMAFTIVVLQELIQGKGVIQGIQEGNIVNLVVAGAAALSVVFLTAFLAVQASQYDEFKVPPPLGTQWQTRVGDEEHILD
jgi:hypothetical protein